jgi:hypothetical protein
MLSSVLMHAVFILNIGSKLSNCFLLQSYVFIQCDARCCYYMHDTTSIMRGSRLIYNSFFRCPACEDQFEKKLFKC